MLARRMKVSGVSGFGTRFGILGLVLFFILSVVEIQGSMRTCRPI